MWVSVWARGCRGKTASLKKWNLCDLCPVQGGIMEAETGLERLYGAQEWARTSNAHCTYSSRTDGMRRDKAAACRLHTYA